MSTEQSTEIKYAYQWCQKLAHSHYENFPVASWLLPASLRGPVAAIYAFARTADDIADEGDTPPAQRIRQLDSMSRQLDRFATHDIPNEPLYIALFDTMQRHRLPALLFQNLISAFKQDVHKTRYENAAELLDYCNRSANPVGRLLLYLNTEASESNLVMSDAICTALQLINFLQDLQSDYRDRNRIYLPRDEMTQFGVSEEDIRKSNNSESVKALIDFQLKRCKQLLVAGSPLAATLRGRFALELRAIILGAHRVLEKLSRQEDLFNRPGLSRRERIVILLQACIRRPKSHL